MARRASVAILDLPPGTAPEGTHAPPRDGSDSAGVDQGVGQGAEPPGGLDVVINNAGIGAQGDVTANDDAEWARVLDINVMSVARVTRAALPHLRGAESAVVVNTSSIASQTGLPQRVRYSDPQADLTS